MPAAIYCENKQVWNGSLQKLHELLRMGDLAAFVGIVDDGGFAESARRRGVSASTLSRSVSRLEAQLKVILLRRTTRSLEITPEGAAVLAEAREILDRGEALQEAVIQAKAWVHAALLEATPLGHGAWPIHAFATPPKSNEDH